MRRIVAFAGDVALLRELAEEAPVVELVSNTMAQAVNEGACHSVPEKRAVRITVGTFMSQAARKFEQFMIATGKTRAVRQALSPRQRRAQTGRARLPQGLHRR